MYSLNITFVMSPNVETQFQDWLNKSVRPTLSTQLPTLNSPISARKQKVVEIGGEKPGADHGLSIALQVDFPDKDSADKWADYNLHQILGEFMDQFGPSAAYFTTLLETTTFI